MHFVYWILINLLLPTSVILNWPICCFFLATIRRTTTTEGQTTRKNCASITEKDKPSGKLLIYFYEFHKEISSNLPFAYKVIFNAIKISKTL